MKKYIAYYRVSSKKQGESGLGLEAQVTIINSFVATKGGKLIEAYTEIETGTAKKKRIEIYKALQQAKNEQAVLITANLLSNNRLVAKP